MPIMGERKQYMLELKYAGEEEAHEVDFKKISAHVVQIIGAPIQKKGFHLSRIGRNDGFDYTGYTTIYREIDGGVQFSDDGSVYVEPAIPEPAEPYVPTLEEVKEIKKQEIWSVHQEVVNAGVDIELSTGTERFPLSDEDRQFLMGKQLELNAGVEEVSYQDSNNHCMFLSAADMQKIITTAMMFVNAQTTYRNNLCEWVEQCTDKESVEAIFYGAEIPEKYWNVVYKKYMSEKEENQEDEGIA